MSYLIEIEQDLSWQTQADWQTPNTPFMQFAYWQALIDSQAIGEGSDWATLFIVLKNDDKPMACLPLFIKDHHKGEYVFDHAWAEAYYRYGKEYYPRLVTSVPFTPVTGKRIWLAKGMTLTDQMWQAFTQAIDQVATQIKASTWHGLFLPKSLVEMDKDKNLLRLGCQFRWFNRNKNGKKF